jgi:16S rRNA (cytidine1402-2'-O)-methyltransferase
MGPGPKVTGVPGTLVLCSTPIGNLGDVSQRLRDTLAGADVVFAEDTRRARTLLQALDVNTPLRSYFAGNERQRRAELGQRLAAGETVALVTDAGTPVVSDPGANAVEVAREVGAIVSIIPGPSAVTGAIAVSGLTGDRFVFEGFLPRKGKDRTTRLESLVSEERTMVVFSAPHRLVEDLEDLASVLGPARQVCAVRELTKLHEEVAWMSLARAIEEWTERAPRGEFTIVIAGAAPPEPDLAAGVVRAQRLIEEGTSPSAAARQAAAETGAPRRSIYDALI